jgi:polyphosphate kinase
MGKKIHPKLIIHAPFYLRKNLLKMIEVERKMALNGDPARIVAKLNALTDPAMIKALYAASQAGVKIDLVVRGICCLKPGIAGVSENIRVVSIVGRFLEHSRAYYFLNNRHQVYCSSADWMERNLSNRIEVCFPILKKKLANRILEEMESYLNDSNQAWELQTNGGYKPLDSSANGVQNLLLKKLASA